MTVNSPNMMVFLGCGTTGCCRPHCPDPSTNDFMAGPIAANPPPLMPSASCARAFVDGNKRTGGVLARLFLALNAIAIAFTATDAAQIMLAFTADDLIESKLTGWFRAHHIGLSRRSASEHRS
jgi:hypothetical protein